MKQVPDSLLAFQHMFPDDDACAAWLIEMRWPDGFVCPACGHEKGWALRGKAHTFECAGCRRQTSVTAGTILHASKLPLTVWFWAAYLMATHSNGISALQLQKQLGIGSCFRPQAAAECLLPYHPFAEQVADTDISLDAVVRLRCGPRRSRLRRNTRRH